MPTEITKTLAQLGLKDNEIKTYLSLLTNKQGLFVSELAKFTCIKRSTINLILERLHTSGFVTFHLDGARKRFSAEAPEALLFRFENSLSDLRGLIPLLNAASGQNKKTKIRFFEGKDGVENILTDILLTLKITKGPKREYLAISSGEDIFAFQPEHQKQFIDKRIKERIPLRWIAPDSPIAHKVGTSREHFRQVKYFNPKKYQFTVEVDVYADKIALLTFGKQPAGVIVENAELAQSFRGLFNLLWDSLK